MAEARNAVLVHGGFVDGSGWESVYKVLKDDGYNVSIVQNPTISLAESRSLEVAEANCSSPTARDMIRRWSKDRREAGSQ